MGNGNRKGQALENSQNTTNKQQKEAEIWKKKKEWNISYLQNPHPRKTTDQ